MRVDEEETSTWKYYGGAQLVCEETGVHKEEEIGKEDEELGEADGENVEEVGGEKKADDVAAKVDEELREPERVDVEAVGDKMKMKTDDETGCMDGEEEHSVQADEKKEDKRGEEIVESALKKEVVRDNGGGKDHEGEKEEEQGDGGEKLGEGNEAEVVVVQVRKNKNL